MPTIAREIERLSAEVRAGRGRLEDLRGSTFQITSIGGIGGLLATPIINHPEVRDPGRRQGGEAAGVRTPPATSRRRDDLPVAVVRPPRRGTGQVGAVFGKRADPQLQNPARLLLPERVV